MLTEYVIRRFESCNIWHFKQTNYLSCRRNSKHLQWSVLLKESQRNVTESERTLHSSVCSRFDEWKFLWFTIIYFRDSAFTLWSKNRIIFNVEQRAFDVLWQKRVERNDRGMERRIWDIYRMWGEFLSSVRTRVQRSRWHAWSPTLMTSIELKI